MNSINLVIVTPAGTSLNDEVQSVVLPTPSGAIEVFGGHTSLITKIDFGFIKVKKDGVEKRYISHDGIAKIDNNEINLIVHGFETKEMIDNERAKAAKERAENRLKNKDPNLDVKRAEFALKKALLRIELFEN